MEMAINERIAYTPRSWTWIQVMSKGTGYYVDQGFAALALELAFLDKPICNLIPLESFAAFPPAWPNY